MPPSSPVSSNFFLSKLISMGYYNFTTNSEGITYLLNTPNTYKDVAHLHQIEQPGVVSAISTDDGVVLSGIRTLGIKNVTAHAGPGTMGIGFAKKVKM
mgnify:CR=1 FL=1